MKYQVPLRWIIAANNGSDDVQIVDERGRPAFRLDGERATATPNDRAGSAANSGARVVTFRDRRGDELGYVTHRQLPGAGGGAAFEVYHGDDLQAVIRRDGCSARHCRFMADGPGPDDLHAEGDLAGREYSFTREGKTVGRVSKSMLAGTTSYGVEVGRGEDEVLMLASAVVIDLCCQPEPAAKAGEGRKAG